MNFSHIPGEVEDMESEWTMSKASLVEAADSSCGRRSSVPWRPPENPVVDTGGQGSRQAEEGGLQGPVSPGVS